MKMPEQKNNRKHKRRFGLLVMLFGVLLIISALILTEYNIWDDIRVGRHRDEVISELKKDGSDASGDYEFAPLMDMPTKKINGYLYVGSLTIPRLGLELPVMDRWDDTRLRIAPCRYTGSVYLNDMIIAAHNYRSHFGKLRNLRVGDPISFEDVDGNKFHYIVAKTEMLEPTAVIEMESGGWDLTLFTCTVGGAARVTVRCTRVKDK